MYKLEQEQFESHLQSLKKVPKSLSYKGSLSLLERPKVAIVGSRKPTLYAQKYTYLLAKELAKRGVCVVSGAAMGVDALAHEGAGASNTIAVLGCGIELAYPAINTRMIEDIASQGLVLSQFENDFRATKWSFLLRNEIVVSLGEVLIVTQADINSGSMQSVKYAKEQGKQIYVLPHPIGESEGSNGLLAGNEAQAIYDIEEFASKWGNAVQNSEMKKDDFFYFCQKNPTLDEAVERFGERVYTEELEGTLVIKNGRVMML
ncbi:MAG: DNA-protecting protein DprA [Campylobacterales bacterium]|nr:DNA-protecting protein DprA [Campylobacterales bacterium]